MTDGVRSVLVYPRVKGADIHIPPQPQQAEPPFVRQKKPLGVPGVVRDRTSEETEKWQARFLPDNPTDTSTIL